MPGRQEKHMHGSWALLGEKLCNSSKYVCGGWGGGASIDACVEETIEETQTHFQSLSAAGHIWISENFSFSGGNAYEERMGGGCKEDEEAVERRRGKGWSKKRRQQKEELKGRAKGQRVRGEHILEENCMHVPLFFFCGNNCIHALAVWSASGLFWCVPEHLLCAICLPLISFWHSYQHAGTEWRPAVEKTEIMIRSENIPLHFAASLSVDWVCNCCLQGFWHAVILF